MASNATRTNHELSLQIDPTSTQHIVLEQRHTFLSKQNVLSQEEQIVYVQNIEKTIAAQLEISSQENFKKIYAVYIGYFYDEGTALADIRRHINIFVQSGNLEEALLRTTALSELSKNSAPDLFLARVLDAGIQNLQGNPETWIILEKELQEKAKRAATKKKAARERAKQRKIARITKNINESQSTTPTTLTNQDPFNSPTKKPVKEEKKEKSSLKIVPSISDGYSDPLESIVIVSSQERKLAKQMRHKEAEERRAREIEEEKKLLPSLTILNLEPTLPPLLSAQELRVNEMDKLLQLSPLTLRELYSLSSLPLEVDKQIENNTWCFTREELQGYFKAMGCVYEANGTNHRKMALPTAIYIKQGNEVITIFNEFGGALTLPIWEKNYVPEYLKKQILAARQKLRALKIKALNIEN